MKIPLIKLRGESRVQVMRLLWHNSNMAPLGNCQISFTKEVRLGSNSAVAEDERPDYWHTPYTGQFLP